MAMVSWHRNLDGWRHRLDDVERSASDRCTSIVRLTTCRWRTPCRRGTRPKNLGYGEARGRALGARHETDQGEKTRMSRSSRMLSWTAAAAVAGIAAAAPVRAEDAVKIGLILPMTGGQASTGKQI